MNNNKTSILKPAQSTTAFLKLGIYGNAGSGKTFTATSVAIGLHKFIKSKKPVAFLDTETGSDFMIPRFNDAKIEILQAKTRAFQDLCKIVNEAETSCDILIIDSISHIWSDFVNGYMEKTKKTRLSFGDWGILKPTWAKFTDLFLNSALHIIVCGRAQGVWDYFRNDDGKMELIKTGTKMKAETEMSYEPSILVEMERINRESNELGKPKVFDKMWIHRATILKDRSDTIHGKFFDDPNFDNFLPVIEKLNLGSKQLGIDTKRSSGDIFDSPKGEPDWLIEKQMAQVTLEEIEATILLTFPSTSTAEKKAKVRLVEKVFNTRSWTAVTEKSLKELKEGLAKIKEILGDEKQVEALLKNGKE